ncbi:hypothetical protein AK812_SmicGene13600 [Symbiodinium microadriaticum]|uniref:Uncharacterized protein n=1 Tax=Symbiodinium microadriaticum TaxID=2951 RepID=A0A1Q9E7N2_SYMMI|nr:hypothetical protein AK812_SmicGene13600 [Symbiodinium microadriaticum]CAE7878478.1 unnamed protein product [Symbiodinium microadriaticum]CAE7944671.1 unnamed protein product [Symbiodinium sp. KB8]
MATSYRFSLEDVCWQQHLRDEGFVVLAGALLPEEVEVAKDLLWRDLEAAYGVSRETPESWKKWPLSKTGLNTKIAQDPGAWYVRACPGVKEAFARIWGSSDLIVSMDALLIWRPWWREAAWRPCTEGLHLDQNPFSKPEFETVQGMVPLLPVSAETGGLEVVPRSHTPDAKAELCREFPYLRYSGDWCPLNRSFEDAMLLLAEPGDLILWDSRTIHGGRVGDGLVSSPLAPSSLARLSVTVAMVPRARATPEVLQARREGFLKGRIFNHSPHEAGTSSGTLASRSTKRHSMTELNESQLALL